MRNRLEQQAWRCSRALYLLMVICVQVTNTVTVKVMAVADALKVVETYEREDVCKMWAHCMEALP